MCGLAPHLHASAGQAAWHSTKTAFIVLLSLLLFHLLPKLVVSSQTAFSQVYALTSSRMTLEPNKDSSTSSSVQQSTPAMFMFLVQYVMGISAAWHSKTTNMCSLHKEWTRHHIYNKTTVSPHTCSGLCQVGYCGAEELTACERQNRHAHASQHDTLYAPAFVTWACAPALLLSRHAAQEGRKPKQQLQHAPVLQVPYACCTALRLTSLQARLVLIIAVTCCRCTNTLGSCWQHHCDVDLACSGILHPRTRMTDSEYVVMQLQYVTIECN